jgi:hypothetical protein
MRLIRRALFLDVGFLGATFLAAPGAVPAQAPAGPLPAAKPQDSPPASATPQPHAQIQPRSSIFGAWKFDSDDSDDARKKMQEARQNRSNGGYGGGPRVGIGIPGMGGGGYGRHGQGQGQVENDDDRQRMQEVLKPAGSITLAQKDGGEVDLTDDQNRRLVFFTDGRKVQKSKDASNQEIAAHWDGTRLVTEEKGPHGGKLSRTLELSSDGTQLYETLHINAGRSNTPLVIRYVYFASGPAPGAPPAGAKPSG